MHRMQAPRLFAALTLGVGAFTAQAIELNNGSFETGGPGSTSNYCYVMNCPGGLSGWSQSGGVVLVGRESAAWGTPGSASADSNFVLGLQTIATISQEVAISGPSTVTLSWSDAGRRNHALQSYTVSFNDQVLGTFSTNPGQSWAAHSVQFAASAAGVLKFATVDLGNADRTTFIDNVKVNAVSAVPEPQTYALMLAGLAALAMVARRRSAARL